MVSNKPIKAIVLAAGEGTRLRPYTEDRPKCMVEYHGKCIIDYCIEALGGSAVSEIVVVSGYLSHVLQDKISDITSKDTDTGTDIIIISSSRQRVPCPIRTCVNEDYASTNMVHSLFAAAGHELSREGACTADSDVIVSYSDIVYRGAVVEKLIREAREKSAPVAIIVDRKWRELWEARMEDPLLDAETLKLDRATGNVVELGKKPASYEDIQGQYIGLLWFSREAIPDLVRYFRERCADQRKMFMTSFIQGLIDDGVVPAVVPVFIDGGWTEVDTVSDLEYKLDWV